jgi:hypothetical protein
VAGAGRGGGEAAAMIANHQGHDSNATIGEKVRTTVTAKEKEEEQLRATHDIDTIVEGRRKRRHCQSSTLLEEDDKEEEDK